MTTERIKALKELAQQDYATYLQSEHWLTIRHAALQRAGFACVLCNGTQSLQVHHRSYYNLGEEKDADVIVLCADCHYRHHFGDKSEIKRPLTEKELADFKDRSFDEVNRKLETGTKLTVVDWELLVWFSTDIPTFRSVSVWKNVTTGIEQIRCDWIPAWEILHKESPWRGRSDFTYHSFHQYVDENEVTSIQLMMAQRQDT